MTKKETTVEEKLRLLYDLQLIDSQIDKLRNISGELPLEVQDLDNEIAGLESRLHKISTELENIEKNIIAKKENIENSKALISKYEEQQKNVRNNREFISISKEIEFQELEIQLSEKHLKEYRLQIENKTLFTQELKEKIALKQKHLAHKKSELDNILCETQKEEEALIKKSEEISQEIDARLFNAYKRIRQSVVNRLAVVPVERGASGGSFFVIPPQVQMEIAARKRIITDEHSGRILIDPALAEEEREKMEAFFKSI